jgi:hypothetical protein
MEIITQVEKKQVLNEVVVLSVRDLFLQKKIIAKIKNLDAPIILWNGEEEYEAAGNWTNESATQRATEVLSLPEIPWAF